MKKLSILIPRYKEPEEIVKPLLDSIMIQQGINFDDIEVIIAQDGKEQAPLSKKFLNSYKKYFNIQYKIFEHEGISATRNHLLDCSSGEYIEFCDDDDMFSTALSLRTVLDRIEHGGFQILFSTFTEEVCDNETKEYYYKIHKDDCVFVHGKVFNKQFLLDKNIRFNNNIPLHEDVYFVAQTYHCSDPNKRVFIDNSFYIWKWNSYSIVRSDNHWLINTYDILLRCNEALIDNFIERGMIEQAQMTALVMTFNLYYKINSPEFMLPEFAEKILQVEKQFKDIYIKFADYMDAMPAEKQQRMVHEVRRKNVVEHHLVIEHITFVDWIAHILEL